ncbi:transmembrane 6 superfamily member 1-like [Mya arenaria]|nr:transmembrane 6 superfamily member 1-like [Mya arenaria]XP_052797082.1 transmembrane 6 superfamily member 1-like [Mya arenaria]
MGLTGPVVVFLMSLVPFPLCFMLNAQPWTRDPGVILALGVGVLAAILLVSYIAVRRETKPDPILYVMSLFMFSSMVDLIIALESDGILGEFMTFYLKEGEPYLWTPYGTMINYWDGVVHYGLCLWILYCVAHRRNYRTAGLYWAGSIINSLLVLVPGSVLGTFGVKPAILLNLPYLFVPLWIAFRLLRQQRPDGGFEPTSKLTSIWQRPVDAIFVLYFLGAVGVDLFRGFIALGCKEPLMDEYLWDHEPNILNPLAYSKVQMLVYMFYFVPYYAAAAYSLLYPGTLAWLSDWALLVAGAAAQGQFSHIGGSLHPRTPPEFLVPTRPHSRQVFWLLNLALLLVPQAFACWTNMATAKRKRNLGKNK